ncbi:surface protein-like [Anabas testudineus]|uniref:surface protein-like n=1 Tax=Anabas testudineus TaxID=64144 RepID=UPI000E4605D3|nr:surface protein-like [Anabas testudineus]
MSMDIPDEILWKHNGNKVVEFDGKEEQVYDVYENRVTLDWVSAELSISNLRYEDSGEYEVETYTKKVFDRTPFKLEVIDKVPKPTISCQRDNDSSSTTHGNQATLSCSAESRQPQYLQYEWISHGTVQPGQKLTITLNDDNEEYSCRVSNPLTSETTKFTAKDCNSDESSSRAWIAGPIFAVVLVIVLVAGILYYKGRQKGTVKNYSLTRGVESNMRRAESEENKPLLYQQDKDLYPIEVDVKGLIFQYGGLTQPSSQATWTGLNKKADTKTSSPRGRKTSSSDSLNNVPGSNKDDADTDQHKEPDSSASEKTPEPEPDPAGLDSKSENDTKTTSPPLGRKPSSSEGLNNVPGSNKDDADAEAEAEADTDQHKEPDPSASEKTSDPDPDPADFSKKSDSDTKTASPPLDRKQSYSEDLNNVPGSNKDDTDQNKEPDSSASEKTSEPEPDPAGLDNKADSDTKTSSPWGKKTSYPKGLNNVPGSNKVNADADQHKETDSSASNQTPEPEPDPAACFTKANRDDVEKQLQPDTTQGSNMRRPPNENHIQGKTTIKWTNQLLLNRPVYSLSN